MMVEPSESAFDDPATWQEQKALCGIRTQDELQTEVAMLHHPVEKLAAIAAIDPDQTQFFARPAEALKEQLGTIAVLDRGSGDHNGEQ